MKKLKSADTEKLFENVYCKLSTFEGLFFYDFFLSIIALCALLVKNNYENKTHLKYHIKYYIRCTNISLKIQINIFVSIKTANLYSFSN